MDSKTNFSTEFAPASTNPQQQQQQQQQFHVHRFSNGEPSGASVELIHSLLGVNSGLPGNHISGLQPHQPQQVNRQQYTNLPLPSLDISSSVVNTNSNSRSSSIPSSNSNSNSNSGGNDSSALLEQLTLANPNLLNSILGTQQAHLIGNPFLFGLNGTGTGCGGGNTTQLSSQVHGPTSHTPLMSTYQQNNNNSLLNNNSAMVNTLGFQNIPQQNNFNPQHPHQFSNQPQSLPPFTYNSNINNSNSNEEANPSEDELNELIIEQQKHINLLETELVQARELIGKLNDYVKTLEQKAAANKKQSRYWTQDEHQRFLEAIEKFGKKDVKAIAQYVGTRNATQVRTHAQKFYAKLDRDRTGINPENKKKKKRTSKEGEESSSPHGSVDDEQEAEDDEEEPLYVDNRVAPVPTSQQHQAFEMQAESQIQQLSQQQESVK